MFRYFNLNRQKEIDNIKDDVKKRKKDYKNSLKDLETKGQVLSTCLGYSFLGFNPYDCSLLSSLVNNAAEKNWQSVIQYDDVLNKKIETMSQLANQAEQNHGPQDIIDSLKYQADKVQQKSYEKKINAYAKTANINSHLFETVDRYNQQHYDRYSNGIFATIRKRSDEEIENTYQLFINKKHSP